jgi:hypothetical protein
MLELLDNVTRRNYELGRKDYHDLLHIGSLWCFGDLASRILGNNWDSFAELNLGDSKVGGLRCGH